MNGIPRSRRALAAQAACAALASGALLAGPALAAPPPALSVQDGAAPADHHTTLSLPKGRWAIFATRGLRPLDTGIADVTCSLVQHTSSGATKVLDSTVARNQAQFGNPQSNAFPRLSFVGVARDVAPSSVDVSCTRADPLIEPDADMTTITAVRSGARSASGRGDLVRPAHLMVAKDDRYRIDATMTLRPLDPISSDTRCSLIASSAAGSKILDTTIVRVQAQFDPPPSASNAFPRLSFTAAAPLPAGTELSVGCRPFTLPGYAQPWVDRATIVLTPLAGTQAQAAGGPLAGAVTLPIPSGVRHIVTATATLRPIDAEALDYRCSLLAGGTVLDSTVVRVQGQYEPPPSASNAFPRLGFTGLVERDMDAARLSIGCIQIGGRPEAAQPTVDLATITAARVH